MPRHPVAKPLKTERPLKAPTIEIPNTPSIKSSALVNDLSKGFKIGSETAKIIAPKIPPKTEQLYAAPNAL